MQSLKRFILESETTTSGCSEISHTERLLMLDEVAICAQLRVIQKDPFRYKAILALRAERAQHLLNCLQTVGLQIACYAYLIHP
jgi:hypothetical protein